MVEIRELIAVRLGSKTKIVFKSSPGYSGILSAVQFVYVVLILVAEKGGIPTLMAAPNREVLVQHRCGDLAD